MIRDPQALTSLSEKLAVLTKLCQRVHPGVDVLHGMPTLTTVPEHYHNLAFVLAYEALEDALEYLRDERTFASRSGRLGDLMKASRPSVAWLDFVTVDAGKNKRDRLAHHGELLASADCLRFVEAIQAQLRAWGVT